MSSDDVSGSIPEPVVSGRTKYVPVVIQGRHCLAPELSPQALEFTFVAKHDPNSNRPFYINILTRNRVWDLPDIADVGEMPQLPSTIPVDDTIFTLRRSAGGEMVFAPKNIALEGLTLRPGHCWIPRPDRINQRYFFLNAETNEKVIFLPSFNEIVERVRRMVKKYNITEFPPLAADMKMEGSSSPRGGESGGGGHVVEQPPSSLSPITTIQEALTIWAGRELMLLADLLIRHGAEPLRRSHVRDQLTAYFTQFAPERLPSIPDLLDQYLDREDVLLGELHKEFGDPPRTMRQRVISLFQRYNPAKLHNVEDLLAQYTGKEDQLIAAVVRRFGPEPEELRLSEEETTRRTAAILAKYDPSEVQRAPEIVQRNRGQEQELLEALVKRYGPEPTPLRIRTPSVMTPRGGGGASDESPRLASPPSVPSESQRTPNFSEHDSFRDRLVAFYKRYNPGKLNSIDAVMQKYQGHESFLMEQLVQRYGPEPGGDASPTSRATAEPAASTTSSTTVGSNVPAIVPPIQLPTSSNNYPTSTVEKEIDAAGSDATGATTTTTTNTSTGSTAAKAKRNRAMSYYSATAHSHRDRVVKMFATYDPRRLSAVDHLLVSFSGRENELIAELVLRYGPEPQVDDDEDDQSTEGAEDQPVDTTKKVEEEDKGAEEGGDWDQPDEDDGDDAQNGAVVARDHEEDHRDPTPDWGDAPEEDVASAAAAEGGGSQPMSEEKTTTTTSHDPSQPAGQGREAESDAPQEPSKESAVTTTISSIPSEAVPPAESTATTSSAQEDEAFLASERRRHMERARQESEAFQKNLVAAEQAARQKPSPSMVAVPPAAPPTPREQRQGTSPTTVSIVTSPSLVLQRTGTPVSRGSSTPRAPADHHHASPLTSFSASALNLLETQLQQALEVGNTASRRTEILYEENIRLSRGYVELREKCDQELRAVREQHEALQQQSNELKHNIAVERIQLKVAEEAALIKAQQETRDELAKLLDQRLEITQEKKLLEEALMDSKTQLWKMEGECRTLESRIARKDRELGDAIAEMKLLKLKYIRAPSADASVQTERSATAEMFTRAVGTPRAPAAEGDASPIEALRRAAILEQEVEHLRETHRVLLAQHEAVIIQRHEAEMEAKQAKQVIMSLQAKKTRLEEAVRRLELRELSHHSPRGKSSFGSPLGNESNQQGVAELQEAEAGLREQLSSTEAENKRLKREIADLRSLLSVHLSSPARRPALRK